MNLLIADEVADMMRCNPDHFRDRISKKKGFPAAVRLGGLLRWHKQEVEQWILAQTVSPTARQSRRRTPGNKSKANSDRSGPSSGPDQAVPTSSLAG